MSLVINTNYAATVASNNLAYSNSMLQNSLNELSSGSKLTTAASDAGGTALALTLNSQATNDGALIQANANSLASLQTADGSLQVAGAILTRMSQLNTLSYNVSGGTGTSATGSYATEFTALQAELTKVDPTGSSFTSDSGSVSGSAIAADIATVASLRAANGASQSVDGFQNTLLTNNQTNAQSQLSTVSDVDVAAASTQLAKWNVLVQAGTAMLAQANQSSQLALKLLQ
jgi:flagellin